MRDDLRAGRLDNALVAADVIAVLVRIQDLGDVPLLFVGDGETFPEVERIDRQCLAGLRTDDQVVEVAVGVGGPDLFDDHLCSPEFSR